MGTKPHGEHKHPKEKTPTFLLELPLAVEAGQAAHLRAHLEAGRQFYNAVLSAGQHRLRHMRADPAWQAALSIPRTHMQERRAAFSALRKSYGFSEYAFHDLGRERRVSWLADHLDAVLAQTLATRAYQYARLVHRKASSPKAKGADNCGYRYVVQLALEGIPYHKPKHHVGSDIIGADLGPSTIALVPREAETSLSLLCEELIPNAQAVRRLQRKLAAHRKSLHGQKVHGIVAVGNTLILEKLSHKAWQKHYGKSVGLRAPGMFLEQLKRTWAAQGRHPERSSYSHHQTVPILSWMRHMPQKTALAAMARVWLWYWASAAEASTV